MPIRPLEPRDIARTEAICLQTAPPQMRKDDRAKARTLLRYHRYYTRAQAAHCWVLTDKQDRAVGYVLCAPHYADYKREFRANEWQELKALGFFAALPAYFEPCVQRKYAKAYPAHLHIDLQKSAQGQGGGTALLDALKEQLQKEHCPGVFLAVGKGNKGAIRFYKRNGFRVLDIVGGAVLMGYAFS